MSYPPEGEVDIVWQNIYAADDGSSWKTFRRCASVPINQILVDFGKAVESGALGEVISVNASKSYFGVTVASEASWAEVESALFSVG